MEETRIRSFLRFGRLFQDDMGIGSSHSGGHYPGPFRAVAGPRSEPRIYKEGRAGKINFRIWLIIMQTRWKHPMLEGEGSLDNSRHPRCRIQVPHVCLYRTNCAITRSLSRGAERFG